jgi:hypothetical protein
LSFDFVRWKLPQARIATLPISYNENEYFICTGSHAIPRRIVSEHLSAGVCTEDLEHKFLAAPYVADYDIWSRQFLKHLRRLNEIVAATGEAAGGNLCYFHHQQHSLYSPPDPRRGRRREVFLRALSGKERVLQIGFGSGHSALLGLTHCDASFTVMNDHASAYSEPAAAYLVGAFPGRLQVLSRDRRDLDVREIEHGRYDMIHLDGGSEPEVFANQIAAIISASKPNTFIVIEQMYLPWVRQITQRLLNEGLVCRYGDMEIAEAAAYRVADSDRRLQPGYFTSLAMSLLDDAQPVCVPSEETPSKFTSDLLSVLGTSMPTGRLEPAAPLVLDGELLEEIKSRGFHAWLIFRNTKNSAESRFLICETQNDLAPFAEQFEAIPAFADSKLLRAVVRAMHLDIGEAADLFFAWSVETHQTRSEAIYVGLPAGTDLEAYYRYPIFDVRSKTEYDDAATRAGQLLTLLECYEQGDGNERSRLALIEALSLAVVRHLERRGEFEQAAEIIARAFRIHPASRHLRAAANRLDERSRSLTRP